MDKELIKKEIPLVLNEETLPIVEQIAEGLPGGFFIYRADKEQEIIFINNAMLKIFGCDNGKEFMEMTGGTFPGMIHPDDVDEVLASIDKQVKESPDNMDYVEYRIIRKDFSIRWIVDYGHFVHTETYGDLFYVFIDDATVKHLRELENQRYDAVIEGLCSAYNSVYLVDFEFESMMPYSLNNMVSQKMLKYVEDIKDYTKIFDVYLEHYVVPEDAEFFKKEIGINNIQNRLKNEKTYSFNFHRYDDVGNIEYVQTFISRIIGENEKLHAVMGFRTI